MRVFAPWQMQVRTRPCSRLQLSSGNENSSLNFKILNINIYNLSFPSLIVDLEQSQEVRRTHYLYSWFNGYHWSSFEALRRPGYCKVMGAVSFLLLPRAYTYVSVFRPEPYKFGPEVSTRAWGTGFVHERYHSVFVGVLARRHRNLLFRPEFDDFGSKRNLRILRKDSLPHLCAEASHEKERHFL